MKTVAIISGKGGTGKTSLLLAFARMAHNAVLADCDVDASNLPVTLQPTSCFQRDIIGSYKAHIDPARCVSCGLCAEHCRFDAITPDFSVIPLRCEGCGVCEFVCQHQAITLSPVVAGTLHVSDTSCCKLVYMDMIPGEEGSGKLVTAVREQATAIAGELGAPLVLIDGSPGIGCPVIATIGAVDLALLVTEPSLSGLGDLIRVSELCTTMQVPCAVCINKCDINEHVAEKIRSYCLSASVPLVGEVPYCTSMARAIELGQDIPESASGAWQCVADSWHALRGIVGIAQE